MTMGRLEERAIRLLAITTLLLAFAGLVPAEPAFAQGSCGNTVTVVAGDTLGGIAERCSTRVSALLEANPDISDPDLIYPGQTLMVPGRSSESQARADVTLTPKSGPPGTRIQVHGSGFSPNAGVTLGAAPRGAESVVTERASTGLDGAFTAPLTIPESAEPYEQWPVVVTTSDASGPRDRRRAAATFDVTPAQAPGAQRAYTVQRGDTLYCIARRFDTTVRALTAENPGIRKPNVIYVGQRLQIPVPEPEGPAVTVGPDQGRPGDTVLVEASGFPPDAALVIGFGRPESEFDVIAEGRTNQAGLLDKIVRVPQFAEPDAPWVFVVVAEDYRTKAVSGVFTVLPPLEKEPTVQISPSSGPVGTTLRVNATGFSGNAEVRVGVGRANLEPTTSKRAWTRAAGELQTGIDIPASAEPGEPWVVVVAAPEQRISAISNTFTVRER